MGKILVTNWKMNKGGVDGLLLLKEMLSFDQKERQVIVCPPAILLREAHQLLSHVNSSFKLGAQDCAASEEGAYTGDISATMIKEAGATYVLVGHSERRLYHQETSDLIHEKLKIALKGGLQPILCVGENKQHREEGLTSFILEKDLQECGGNLPLSFIAYEPLWAIGTGHLPSLDEISQAHQLIKEKMFQQTGLIPHVLYGGSVTPDNISSILELPTIDGVLVGGASLDLTSISKIMMAF